MHSGMYTIFGTTYYTHGIGLIFVFPFAVWFLITVAKSSANYSKKRKPIGLSSMVLSASISLLVFAGVFLDVFLTGQKASRLCDDNAGLRIYKNAEAEGILGLSDIEYWSDYGFEFVEIEYATGEKYRKSMTGGKINKIEVNVFKSKFEMIEDREYASERILISRTRIVKRESGEIYSEWIVMGIYPGWADSLFINLTGTNYRGWSCGKTIAGSSGKEHTLVDFIKATITPEKK